MSKTLRRSQSWFQRALWLVAFAFAWFLIGLGGKLVDNLGSAEPLPSLEQFIDAGQAAQVRTAQERADKVIAAANDALAQARQQHQVAQANTHAAAETFQNWLATRHATARPDQDPDLIARTRELDALKTAERLALSAVQRQQQVLLDAQQERQHADLRRQELEKPAHEALERAMQRRELHIFLYRLMLTAPLLAVAGWLYAKQRKSAYWPFVWGFIFFAGFAFFVELVPYLPSYGGYVRYLVGIVLTVVIGRQAIVGLQRYLARQQQQEALPELERRATLNYELALKRLGNSLCPGCERSVDLKESTLDYCPHCGIGLFDHCGRCKVRKNAFLNFCQLCGTPARPHEHAPHGQPQP
ncbi:serine endopeptidase [Rugamonas apoptosis]|uniref:Serine endopeptidase n=1 Tax=Rugamonas apoptosis TaxID=2758570 RepID=A0A7W2F9J2_9BURK|nr:serine endopeptidase [Rugamonas apoptosis]MBA5687575.1 serine endopeptidase [Rugamonas apoptosis]